MIFFDIDGTLIDHATASATASLHFHDRYRAQIPFPREQFPEVWERILMKHFERFCRGELSVWGQRRERMREVFGDSRLPDVECDRRYRDFVAEYEPATRAYADVNPALKQLREQRLGIISNGIRDQQIGKLERAGLLPFFSVMVFSEDAGLGKPAPQIFREACLRAGDAPADCIYIGDHLQTDIIASRGFGMRAIWVDRSASGTRFEDVPAIASLRDLQSALNTCRGKTAALDDPDSSRAFASPR
jgi:putative hydrolase of the HAD superfamily